MPYYLSNGLECKLFVLLLLDQAALTLLNLLSVQEKEDTYRRLRRDMLAVFK